MQKKKLTEEEKEKLFSTWMKGFLTEDDLRNPERE